MIRIKYLLLLLAIHVHVDYTRARGIIHVNPNQDLRINKTRLFSALKQAVDSSKLKTAFVRDGIVPDYLLSAPDEMLFVKYVGVEVDLGDELLPFQTKRAPAVNWNAPSLLYTLIMLDLDNKSSEDASPKPHLHWLVTNIPRNHLHHGALLVEYVSPNPAKGSGMHRYVFLVYKQKRREHFVEFLTDFDLDEFADTYTLGQPVAGNFFTASYNAPEESSN